MDESEIDEVLTFDNKRILASFRKKIRAIHPAIDVINGKAAIGVWIPCTVTLIPKGKNFDDPEVKAETYERDMLFLVFSDGKKELVFANGKEGEKHLREYQYVLKARPAPQENRWSLEKIKEFLDHKVSVDPVAVYELVRDAAFNKYIEFADPRELIFLTLWTIGTYFHQLFSAYPYVYVGGIKRVGKSKLLLLIQLLAFNGVQSVSITTPSIFRMIQDNRPTICIDETEKLHEAERGSEWRAVLLGGYKKGSFVYRVEGDKKRYVAQFEIYSPKIIANIAGIEDVMEDRAIPIFLYRSMNSNILNAEVTMKDSIWQEIRNSLYVLFLNHFSELSACYEDSELILGTTQVQARERELWKPIIAMASFFEKHGASGLVEEMKTLAEGISKQKLVESITENADIILAQNLPEIVTAEDEYYNVKQIKMKLSEALEYEQPPNWLTNAWVGRSLRRLGFKDKRRLGTGYQYRLPRKQVESLLRRLEIEGGPRERSPHSDAAPSSLKFTAIPYSEGMPFCEVCGSLQAMWYWEKQDKKVCVCDKCKREILRGEKHGD